MPGGKILEQVEITLRNRRDQSTLTVFVDIFDNSLSRKWLVALNDILTNNLHLEKNYCFLGFADSERNADFLVEQINRSIRCINAADIGYHINDRFTVDNTIQEHPTPGQQHGRVLMRDKLNRLHRYFEDLQGFSGRLSEYYIKAPANIRWHIRQLNLLCHEFECWALSYRKQIQAPPWQRPSQLMCWLNAPRFRLDQQDLDQFGIDTLERDMGGVFLGVNKAVGKHHWEVYNDEGRDSRISELTTSALRSQTEAAGDFDIEWGRSTRGHPWHADNVAKFRIWLINNGFDPEDPALTIGHPQLGQIDLDRSFGSNSPESIWSLLNQFADVSAVKTSAAQATYSYHWSDADYAERQIEILRNPTR